MEKMLAPPGWTRLDRIKLKISTYVCALGSLYVGKYLCDLQIIIMCLDITFCPLIVVIKSFTLEILIIYISRCHNSNKKRQNNVYWATSVCIILLS